MEHFVIWGNEFGPVLSESVYNLAAIKEASVTSPQVFVINNNDSNLGILLMIPYIDHTIKNKIVTRWNSLSDEEKNKLINRFNQNILTLNDMMGTV